MSKSYSQFKLEDVRELGIELGKTQFLKLEGNRCSLDPQIFYHNELPKLLGVLRYVVDFYE